MSKVLRAPTTLAEVKGHRGMQTLCQAIRSRYDIDVYGFAVRYDDTIATYQINTQDKLGKAKEADIRTFTDGVLAGMRAAGMI